MYAIGIDLGATFVKIGLVDNRGKVYFRRKIKTPLGADKTLLIDSIVNNVKDIIKESGKAVSGIGIGVPGPVDSKKGIVHYFPNIKGWKEVPLKAMLEKKLGLAVMLDNDVNAMSLGEFVFGAGKGSRNIVCLTLGTGVGGGIIIDSKLYRGGSMTAGEVGHMPINETGPICNCGGIACLERYIGNRYILERAKKIFGNSVTLERVSELAGLGDKKALAIWTDVAEKLSVALSQVVNLLNPDKIVIGGGVSKAGPFILNPLKKEIRKRAMKDQAAHVKIVPAKLGADAGIIGASLLLTIS
ncbi:MAG: ROK family protein [Candidatus Omnitrophica bacterium]|nr:ROK family protein [Candidatus Omnitrophota bacterium]